MGKKAVWNKVYCHNVPFRFRVAKGCIRPLHHLGLFLTFKVSDDYVKVFNEVIQNLISWNWGWMAKEFLCQQCLRAWWPPIAIIWDWVFCMVGPELGREEPGIPTQTLKDSIPGLVSEQFCCHQSKTTQIREFCEARIGEEMRWSSMFCGSQAWRIIRIIWEAFKIIEFKTSRTWIIKTKN